MIRDNYLGRVTEDRSDGIFPAAVDVVCSLLISENTVKCHKQR
jgi:hypothetical protein